MATFRITERKKQIDDDGSSWEERVENLDGVEVLQYGSNWMRVKADDEIALRMVCSDVCSVERV